MNTALGFDSVTNYCVLGYRESKDDPHFEEIDLPDYSHLRNLPYSGRNRNILKTWQYVLDKTRLPYYPVVTVGRDCSPRVEGPAEESYQGRYGNRPILDNATPTSFREEVATSVRFYQELKHEQVPLIFINSWNEWTEGAYLEPDAAFEYGHLSVVKEFATSLGK